MFSKMTKDEALEYCHKHGNKYKASLYADGVDGAEVFDGLVALLESGTIEPSELPDYGMDYEEQPHDQM